MSIIGYYVSGNTAKGPLHYLTSNLNHLNQVIVLKHPSETVKTRVIKKVLHALDMKQGVEIIKSPLGNTYLDGILIRESSTAILTDRMNTKLDRVIELDLGEAQKTNENYRSNEEKYLSLMHDAYANFATGLNIHDELEAIYIKEMNFERADKLADDLIAKLLKSIKAQSRQGHVFHRFFGTNTVDGVVNEVPGLIEDIANVYFIKGRAGTGKSTFMKKIATACERYNFDVELYHCSFDPNSLDMVRVPELDFCIFDSTDPHEFFPERDGEIIIDLYEETVTKGTDEKYADQINAINTQYKSYMKKGIQDIQKASVYLEKNENQFTYSDEEMMKAFHSIMKIVSK
ncbi:hypothetical protein [Oceanobacillus saliphilus]|uniref:hypothetical protein n=1 Tax=Oceanobacillus saliphilus TaxID=2925834 RepID=UPI00201E1BC0|nr:hypothetical protein [Oceanobacillus saliphilus]